jgi:hypothetical protein
MPNEVAEYFAGGRKNLVSAMPTSDYSLCLEFEGGERRLYELKDKLTGVLAVLLDANKFNEVFVDENGNIAWNIDESVDSSINWGNRIDLCADSVYIYSKRLGGENVEEN